MLLCYAIQLALVVRLMPCLCTGELLFEPSIDSRCDLRCSCGCPTGMSSRMVVYPRYMEDEEWERLLALIGKNLAPRALRPALPRA
jgi:hypothetical protein